MRIGTNIVWQTSVDPEMDVRILCLNKVANSRRLFKDNTEEAEPYIKVDQILEIFPMPEMEFYGERNYIEVVVSSIVKNGEIGELKLIWESSEFTFGDRLVLYRSGDAVFEYEPYSCSGSINTNTFIGDVNLTHIASPYCTIYSAGYIRNNETVAYSCLQNSPTWMNDIRSQIENFSLPELFIPGTHVSASYIISKTGYFDNILQKYVYTQDISVYEQLVMGARYLDLRVGYYNHTIVDNLDGGAYNWWCNHDFIPVQPLIKVLQQIRQFMTTTNEIVIVDFHNFPVGFKRGDTHMKLGKFLWKELGDLIHEKTELGYGESLKSVWESGKRLILAYNKGDIVDHFSFFGPIKQHWGNKQTLTELYSYLGGLLHECEEEGVWAAMAELTPTTLSVLTDWYGGLRLMAERVNTNISLSYRYCKDWTVCSNIVAVDFLRSSSIVSTAVTINKARANQHNTN